MIQATKTTAKARRTQYTLRGRESVYSEDKGCTFWARCGSCPWRLCLREELSPSEQARVRAAVTLLQGYVAPAGGKPSR